MSVRHKEITVQKRSDRRHSPASDCADSPGCEHCSERAKASELYLGCCRQPAHNSTSYGIGRASFRFFDSGDRRRRTESSPVPSKLFSIRDGACECAHPFPDQVNDSPVTNDLPASVWRGFSDHSMASSTTTPALSRPGSPNRISFIRASSTTESDSGWILEFRDVCEGLRAVLLLVPLLYTLP